MKTLGGGIVRLVALLALFPLASGIVIVHYRDAAVTHLPGKAAMVEQIRSGQFPFVNPYASCGEPLAGNPNHAVLFPDTVVFAAAPLPIAFGIHFALALALAWTGARRWARAEGASRFAAECAGIAFALSGPFLSAWTFYNAGMTLAVAPWVLAAAVKLARRSAESGHGVPGRAIVEMALATALLAVAGEPVAALLTVTLVVARYSAAAWIPRPGGIRRGAPALAAGFALAALLASPQILLTWQASTGSSRDLAPYRFVAATSTSVHPARLLEQVVPFPFGRPDVMGAGGFRRHDLFQGNAPYLWTLHLGWVPLLLLALYGRVRSPAERVGAAAALAGVVLSLGAYLPGARLLYPVLSLGGRIRYPVKWWYVVSLALVPLLAAAADRWLTRARRPWMLPAAIALPPLVLIAPLFRAALDRPPAPIDADLSGRIYERVSAVPHDPNLAVAEPALTTREFFRRAPRELWATTGARSGAGYAFDADPDGSYSFHDRVMREATDSLPWPDRAKELRLAGVGRIVSADPLPEPFREIALLDRGRGIRLYALDGASPPVRRASRILEAPNFNAVLDLHRAADFDPRTDAVVAARSASVRGEREAGRVEIVAETADSLAARVEGRLPALVVWSRTYFPAWEAAVDGEAAPVTVAEGHLVGVAVPAGAHEVRVRWSRRPLHTGLALLGAGLVAVVVLSRRRR